MRHLDGEIFSYLLIKSAPLWIILLIIAIPDQLYLGRESNELEGSDQGRRLQLKLELKNKTIIWP